MTPESFLASLQSAGFVLRPEGDSLLVSPASKLTAEQKAGIRQHKAELLALLQGEPDNPFLWLPLPRILWERDSSAGARNRDKDTGGRSAGRTAGPSAGTNCCNTAVCGCTARNA